MKQGWEIKKLGEVCNLYQPRTISGEMLVEDGKYLVYGANGIIGRYNEYNHENSEVLLTCRGATCGTINMSEPYSWINGNAMVVQPKNDNIGKIYLQYLLQAVDWGKVITGAAQPQITRQSLSPLDVIIPPREEQERIVAELDCLSGVIEKKREQLKQLDALAQSIFYQMFGDPITNEKGWEVKNLGEVCDIYRGGSPRPIEQYLGGNIPWIKIGDAVFGTDIYLTKTKEHIIEEGLKKARFIHSGSLIFANCGVSLGFARIITFDGCIHDGWLAFDNISNDINKIFLLKSLNFCTQYFRETAPDGTQPNLNTGIMKAFVQIIPPLTRQQEFADKIEAIEKQKELIKKSISETETLFNARMDYYFN